MGGKIRVLIVEDSNLMRRVITDIIKSDPDLEVAAEANDGETALEQISRFKPDVVTLDINLHGLSGLDVLSKIVDKRATRVVMLSAYSSRGASFTIKALELGAVDFIAKPSGEISLDLPDFKEEIISKIKLAAGIDLDKVARLEPGVSDRKRTEEPFLKKVVVIGASTGGPKAVLEVMQQISYGLPAAFLIVQHMPAGFTLNFAERISWKTGIKTKEAEDGDIIMANRVFVAPGGNNTVLENCQGQAAIRLNKGEKSDFIKPSIDKAMFSAVDIFGENVIGVILTGMCKDGLEGARRIKEKGGVVIVQDEKTSVVWGMPKAVFKAGLADKILPVSEIAQAIVAGV